MILFDVGLSKMLLIDLNDNYNSLMNKLAKHFISFITTFMISPQFFLLDWLYLLIEIRYSLQDILGVVKPRF